MQVRQRIPGGWWWRRRVRTGALALAVSLLGLWWNRSGALPPALVADPATFVPGGLVTAQAELDLGSVLSHEPTFLEWLRDACGRARDTLMGSSPPSICADPVACLVRTYQSDEEGAFEVIVDGRRLVAGTGARMLLLQSVPGPADAGGATTDADASEPTSVSGSAELGLLATDVTGDGVTDVLISEWTGGAHGCFGLIICQFLPSLRVQRIELGHGGASFVHIDADPAMALVVPDWSFASWETSFARSPAPRMVLKFDGASWRPSAELMRAPPEVPDAAVLAARWKRFVGQGGGLDAGDAMAPWAPLLDLIYTGNAAEAWRLLEAAWPGDATGARTFRARLLQVLRGSPAWPALVELNGAALGA